jgi:hypothetical protein
LPAQTEDFAPTRAISVGSQKDKFLRTHAWPAHQI